ncbi:hypothetical protein llg_41830 [Luteolibacter sp. LG18]|nr:hypothetical protein llg_41830 [Luteolibacter sp. LG18]
MGWIVPGILAVAPIASAEIDGRGYLVKVPQLTTLNHRTFHTVSILSKRPDGVSILHSEGAARIPYEQLPADLARQLGGFEEDKALAFRSADRLDQARAEREGDRRFRDALARLRESWRKQKQEMARQETTSDSTWVNPLHLPPRPLTTASVSTSGNSYGTYTPETVTVVVSNPVSSTSSCEPSCPPPPPPPCKPYTPCATNDYPQPRPPVNPCATTDRPKPPEPSSPPPSPPSPPPSSPQPSSAGGVRVMPLSTR